MRLLVPTRISLALRRATSSPLSHAVAAAGATRVPMRGKNSAPDAAGSATPHQLLQQLWEFSKSWDVSKGSEERWDRDPCAMFLMEKVMNGEMVKYERRLLTMIHKLCNSNDFESIAKLLEGYSQSPLNKEPPNVMLVHQVLWTAAQAKSLGALPPSILKWIEAAVLRLPEPFPSMKESMIWLLSILRDDLPLLRQLQRESRSKYGRVGPELERKRTLRYAALAFLQSGKGKNEFRSLWTWSESPVLGDEDQPMEQQAAATMHHAMMRNTDGRKRDPSMLGWYANLLVAQQRTPIEELRFNAMMTPLIRTLGGKIEKWRDGDRRMEKLRKWRDDYKDVDLDNLVKSLLDFTRHRIVVDKHGSLKDLSRLEKMLTRLSGEVKRRETVVIDWLNLNGASYKRLSYINNFLRSFSLVVVGREKNSEYDHLTPLSPEENNRTKVMEVTSKAEKTQEMDDVCSMILAVATRGHLLSNDKTRPHIVHFKQYLLKESKDVNQSILLKNYLNDAVLRHDGIHTIQPAVDHSKAAQWIDEGKTELAFTVARKFKDNEHSPFRFIDYYSLHLD